MSTMISKAISIIIAMTMLMSLMVVGISANDTKQVESDTIIFVKR